MRISIEVLQGDREEERSLGGLAVVRNEWSELWKRSGKTLFQSPDWLLPWWRWLGRGKHLVVAARLGNRLVGICPWQIEEEQGRGRVVLMGGDETDYQDVLFEPDLAAEIWLAVLEYLERHRGIWDECEFLNLPAESVLLNLELPPGWKEERVAQEACPLLEMRHCEGELSRTIPSRQFAKLRYYQRRAEGIGPVEFQTANKNNFEELFQGFLELHRMRWESAGERGVLGAREVQGFHHEAARAFLGKEMLRLYVMRIRGCLAASFYGFEYLNRVYYYLGGFHPDFAAVSPGTIMLGHAIQEAIREGVGSFDFLRGAERYKYFWGAEDRLNFRRTLRLEKSAGKN
jgi:CelD/BcsL family acetyltransferase involved in cellulose biosynthesis